MNATCLFENSSTPCHGNRTKGTHKLYLCDGLHDNSLTATTQLELDGNSLRRTIQTLLYQVQDGLVTSVVCNNGTFDYHDLSSMQCRLPDGFHEKYEKIDGTTFDTNPDATFTVHDFKDLLNDSLSIRCKNTHYGEPIVTSCQETPNGSGILQIRGCEENQRHFEQTDMIGYTGIQTSGNNTIKNRHEGSSNRMCDIGFTSRASINDLIGEQNNDELFRTNGITMRLVHQMVKV